MSENWKSINGYENYEISDHGNIKNITTQRMRKQNIDRSGYNAVTLHYMNTSSRHNIHRLVAEAFLENPENKACIDHIDRNK